MKPLKAAGTGLWWSPEKLLRPIEAAQPLHGWEGEIFLPPPSLCSSVLAGGQRSPRSLFQRAGGAQTLIRCLRGNVHCVSFLDMVTVHFMS